MVVKTIQKHFYWVKQVWQLLISTKVVTTLRTLPATAVPRYSPLYATSPYGSPEYVCVGGGVQSDQSNYLFIQKQF